MSFKPRIYGDYEKLLEKKYKDKVTIEHTDFSPPQLINETTIFLNYKSKMVYLTPKIDSDQIRKILKVIHRFDLLDKTEVKGYEIFLGLHREAIGLQSPGRIRHLDPRDENGNGWTRFLYGVIFYQNFVTLLYGTHTYVSTHYVLEPFNWTFIHPSGREFRESDYYYNDSGLVIQLKNREIKNLPALGYDEEFNRIPSEDFVKECLELFSRRVSNCSQNNNL